MKNICLLGATGSIGQSTLDIIKANPDKYCLKAFSFCHNIKKAKENAQNKLNIFQVHPRCSKPKCLQLVP